MKLLNVVNYENALVKTVFDRPTQKEKKKKGRYQDFNKYPKERKPFINLQQGASKFFHGEKKIAPFKGK